jgi:hypothetical protein
MGGLGQEQGADRVIELSGHAGPVADRLGRVLEGDRMQPDAADTGDRAGNVTCAFSQYS